MTQEPIDEKEVFNNARRLAVLEERSAYLQQVCGHEPKALHRIEELLNVHFQESSFLESPAIDSCATLDTPTEAPGTLIGPYKLLEQIGEGGMGLVFVAEQQEPIKRRVALKVIKPGMDTRQVIARFEAERQALALMDHPHIAKVHDGGTTSEGRPYFVMELVKGTPITDFCDQHRLSTRQRLELFLDVCHAVQHAHQKGIIHRDLKPSNVLVEIHDVHPVVKVIDFGVAKAIGQQLTDKTVYTEIAQLVGTPLYMSPEQAGLSSLDVDTRSDVYSLGVLLYELLTGTTPFYNYALQKAGYDEMRRIIREEEPPRPSTRLSTMGQAALSTIAARRGLEPRRLSQQLRGELDWIVMKALEKDRNRRYQSTGAFAADVQRYLDDEPVLACPPSKLYRLGKLVRRHKAGLGVAAVLLLTVLLGASSLLWWLQKQAGAAGEARMALREASELMEAERWSEALSAARRAQGVLRGFGADSDLRQKVEELAKDLEMAQELEEARLQGTAVKEGHFDIEASVAALAKSFTSHGLDVEHLDVGTAAEYIRSRSIPRQLVAALDLWARYRRWIGGQEWKHLLAVARAADPDEWRNRFRDAWERNDVKTAKDLLASADVEKLLPTTLSLLELSSSQYKNMYGERAAALLRRAQRRNPADFWINHDLAKMLHNSQPPQLEEAIGYYRAAVALRPQSPGVRVNFGNALHDNGQLDEAIVEFREAIRIKKDDPLGYSCLGGVLCDKGLLDAAIVELREAIRLSKDLPHSHRNLGIALMKKGRLDEAIAEFHQAIRIDKDFAEAHNSLGSALKDKGLLDEAITEYREAIRLKKYLPAGHYNLGLALLDKDQLDEAIDEFREAIRIKKNYSQAHTNLGNALYRKGRLDDAIAEYREAIRIKNNSALPHNNLGAVLRDKGRLDEAIAEFREALRINNRFALASTNLRQAEQVARLEDRLPRILEGKEHPKDAAERLAFAWLCQQTHKKLYTAATRFYHEAFADKPPLADDLNAQHRYNAACAAALAGCGQGKDAASLGNKEHGRLRRQALNWLKEDLQAWQRLLETDPGKASPLVRQNLHHWLHDPDFNGVRGAEALSKLPENERQSWQQLWREVADTLAKCQGKATTKKKSETK